jgi:hypothetical protein
MTTLRNLLLAVAAIALMPSAIARAGTLSLVFDSTPIIAAPGDTITFSGTATNLANLVVDLNSCAVFLPGQFTTDNCAMFFGPTGAPLTLSAAGDPGDSAHFDMFVVNVNSPFAAPFGLQPPGTFTIIGALEDPAGILPDTNLAQANFQVDVVPEPGTATLLALALPIAFVLRRRTMRP